jgi:hypothetical protein
VVVFCVREVPNNDLRLSQQVRIQLEELDEWAVIPGPRLRVGPRVVERDRDAERLEGPVCALTRAVLPLAAPGHARPNPQARRCLALDASGDLADVGELEVGIDRIEVLTTARFLAIELLTALPHAVAIGVWA